MFGVKSLWLQTKFENDLKESAAAIETCKSLRTQNYVEYESFTLLFSDYYRNFSASRNNKDNIKVGQ